MGYNLLMSVKESCPTYCKAFKPGEKCYLQVVAEVVADTVPPVGKQTGKIKDHIYGSTISTEISMAHKIITKIHEIAEKNGCPLNLRSTKLYPNYPGKAKSF